MTRLEFTVLGCGAALLVLAVAAQAQAAGPVVQPPRDDAAKDPSFAAYRAALMKAVKKRDVERLVAASTPEIKLSFGGQHGRKTLRALLSGKGAEGADRPAFYWRELETILGMGGVFNKHGNFCAPYPSCVDVTPCPDCDAFDTIFVTAKNAPAHAKPDGKSRVVSRHSYNVLRYDFDKKSPEDWLPVKLPTGGTGYVRRTDLRMPVDYRAYFTKIDGKWMMKMFLGGD